MATTRWDQRFFTSTRGRIVTLLRRADRTVDELAQELDLTDNAVRAHLAALERDGLARQVGVRRGAGKPSYAYALAPDAARLFGQAYAPTLRELLAVLAARLDRPALEDLLRETGRRLAATLPAPDATDAATRLAAAAAALNDLGGLVEVEAGGDQMWLRGYSCPLGAV